MTASIALASALLGLSVAPRQATPGQLPPGTSSADEPACASPVAWTQLQYQARKLLLTATATVTVEMLPVCRAASDLRRPPQGDARDAAGACVAVLRMRSEVPIGRDEDSTAWLDAADGGVLQVDKVASGRGAFRKVFRYGKAGFFMWRSAPADRDEEQGGPQRWTKRKTASVSATLPPGGLVLTDSYALLYQLSLVPRERGDTVHRALMFADDRLMEVTFRVGGLSLRDIDYRESWPDGARRLRQKRLLRQATVTASPVGAARPDADVDLGFLGMKGELTVWIDMDTGVPVELDGRADTVGRLQVTLERATLRERPGEERGEP